MTQIKEHGVPRSYFYGCGCKACRYAGSRYFRARRIARTRKAVNA